MPAPLITDLPDPPLRSEDPATFVTKAEAFVAALPEFVTDANALATYLEALSVGAGITEEEARVAVQEWAPNFTAAGDVYIPAVEAMTIAQGNAQIGTGTLAFAKSTTAAPSTFNSTTLPATLQTGAWLKVSATGVTGFVATHLKRTA